MLDEASLDLRRLRVLREIDRRGTVSAAAAALHLTPSAVSQQIAGLARDLDVPLLERHGRGVRLTGQARVLLRHADVVAEQLQQARADLAGWSEGTAGTVRVGSLSTGIAALVGPAIARLRAERPTIQVSVVEVEPPVAVQMIDDDALDLLIAVDYRDAPSRRDARYLRRDLLSDPMDVVLPAGHPLATPELMASGIELGRLADEVWVSSEPSDPCAMITTAVCAVAGFSPEVQHECQDWDAAGALVAAGCGVALVPRLAQPLRHQGLVRIPVAGSPAARLLFALTRASAHAAPPIMAVLDAIMAVAAERPDAVA